MSEFPPPGVVDADVVATLTLALSTTHTWLQNMVNSVGNGKNIWVAASDGDLERVKVGVGRQPR